MPPDQPPPPGGQLEFVSDYLCRNAIFEVPEVEKQKPCEITSTSMLQESHIALVVSNAPKVAFYDPNKAQRFIDALEQAIQGKRLQESIRGNGERTNDQVRHLYDKLFHPLCKEQDGISKDDWQMLTNETVCNRLTHNAVLFALKSVTWRLTDKKIFTMTEPSRVNIPRGAFDSTASETSIEKVDHAVFELGENGRTPEVLFLVEGKAPGVLRGFSALLDGVPIIVDLNDQTGPGRKILNKAIYYMYLWKIDRLVLTSFQNAHILELHWIKEDEDDEVPTPILSYSGKIEQHMKSELFRALLGMTLVTLKVADLQEFNAKTAYNVWLEDQRARAQAAGLFGGDPDLGGSYSGSNTKGGSDKKGGSRSDGKTSTGKGRKRTTSIDKQGAKRSSEEAVEEQMSTNDAIGNPSKRITRSMAKTAGTSDRRGKVGSDISIAHRSETLHVSGDLIGSMTLERDSKALFPNLSTAARIPCLKVLAYRESNNGIVYEAALQNPDGSVTAGKAGFIIKAIKASQLSRAEYRNSFLELIKEYKTYYLLALAKRAGRCTEIIEKFTPTCYGLYQGKDESKGVYALVMDHVGEANLNDYTTWSESDKIALLQSLLALHSIGLYHGDPDERNVAVRRNVNGEGDIFQFFDFGNSYWHTCPGITDCEELKIQVRILYDMQEPPFSLIEFQERAIREHRLPFCNLEEIVGEIEAFKYERVVLRMERQANKYEYDYTYS